MTTTGKIIVSVEFEIESPKMSQADELAAFLQAQAHIIDMNIHKDFSLNRNWIKSKKSYLRKELTSE